MVVSGNFYYHFGIYKKYRNLQNCVIQFVLTSGILAPSGIDATEWRRLT